MTTQYEMGVIGAGQAAEGIVHGIVRNTMLFDDRMIASDPSEVRRKLFADRFNIQTTADNQEVVDNSFIIILAVKPQQFIEVCQGFSDRIRDDHLIVSIMAGVRTETLEAQFKHVKARVVRAMPNLPIHVGAGMAGICKGRHANEADLLRAQRIFEAGGRSIVIENEDQMDAVTAVSGSGPAYFYYFVEAMTAAGIKVGLNNQQAEALAKQTCLGAARMLLESDDSPATLRAKVTSPGGTTQAALESMASNNVFEHIVEGIQAATRRSAELGH